MTDHIGVVFVYGLYLKGKWIPEPTVYAFGLFQVSLLGTLCKKTHMYMTTSIVFQPRYSSFRTAVKHGIFNKKFDF